MTLLEFISVKHRFRWGGIDGDDCMTWCGRWVGLCAGADPIAYLRGSYSDANGASRLIERSGGLVALATNVLEVRGFQKSVNPQDGDVGIVRNLIGFEVDGEAVREHAAIRFGPTWAALAPRGVVARPAECIVAWSLSE